MHWALVLGTPTPSEHFEKDVNAAMHQTDEKQKPSPAAPRDSSVRLAGTGMTKSFGERTLWHNVDLECSPGTITALWGHSGVGKTSLLQCLGLLEDLSAGMVHFNGVGVSSKRHRQRRRLYREHFAFMLQNVGLVDDWTVMSNLNLALRRTGASRSSRKAEAFRALELVGMQARANSPVYSLSGGEKQRVSFARAIARQPQVLFVDEPTASLDEANAQVIRDLIVSAAENGTTIVISTHDPFIRDLAHQVIDLSS